MKWKQHWNSKQVIYNRLKNTFRTDSWNTHTGGCTQKTPSCTQYSRKTHIKIYKHLILVTQYRQWHLHLQCSWQYKSAEMINYKMVDPVFAPMKSKWLCFAWKKHKIKMLCHIILHNFRYWSGSRFKSNKAAGRFGGESLSRITIYKSRAENLEYPLTEHKRIMQNR